jgi:hypothetical protein
MPLSQNRCALLRDMLTVPRKSRNEKTSHCTLTTVLVYGHNYFRHGILTGDQLMTTMQDREKAFEAKFALDEELRFKSEARRNKLLGLWAAGLLGKSDPEAYAKEVVVADFEEAGHEDVVRKIKADFDAAGVAQSEEQIRVRMLELLGVAIEQVQSS